MRKVHLHNVTIESWKVLKVKTKYIYLTKMCDKSAHDLLSKYSAFLYFCFPLNSSQVAPL